MMIFEFCFEMDFLCYIFYVYLLTYQIFSRGFNGITTVPYLGLTCISWDTHVFAPGEDP